MDPTEPAGRLYYRIILTEPPTVADFMSNQAKGLPRRPTETPDIWTGLSHYGTEAQARATAQRFPRLGAFIAAVQIREGNRFRVEQTFHPGHYTLWGDPQDFLDAVVTIVSVS